MMTQINQIVINLHQVHQCPFGTEMYYPIAVSSLWLQAHSCVVDSEMLSEMAWQNQGQLGSNNVGIDKGCELIK